MNCSESSPSLEVLKTQVGPAVGDLLFLALLWARDWSRWPLACHTASLCVRFCQCCCWITEYAQTWFQHKCQCYSRLVILLLVHPLILSLGLCCFLREEIKPPSHCCILSRVNCKVDLKKRIAKRLFSRTAVFQTFFFLNVFCFFSGRSCDMLIHFSAVKLQKLWGFFCFLMFCVINPVLIV